MTGAAPAQPGLPEQAGKPHFSGSSLEVGRVLVKALSELANVKRNLVTADAATALEKAETLLRQQAEAILAEGMQFELGRSFEQADVPRLSMLQRPLDFKRGKAQRDLVEQLDSQASLKSNLLHNPTTDLARTFLHHRFGIPLPSAPSQPVKGPAATLQSGLIKGSNVDRPCLLPRVNRENPFAPVPLHYVDREIKHGLYHLINRGIIPAFSNLTDTLTGENNVLHARQSVLLPFHLQFCRPPGWDAAPDPGRPAKLDMLGPPGLHRSALGPSGAPRVGGPAPMQILRLPGAAQDLSAGELRPPGAISVPTSIGAAAAGAHCERDHSPDGAQGFAPQPETSWNEHSAQSLMPPSAHVFPEIDPGSPEARAGGARAGDGNRDGGASARSDGASAQTGSMNASAAGVESQAVVGRVGASMQASWDDATDAPDGRPNSSGARQPGSIGTPSRTHAERPPAPSGHTRGAGEAEAANAAAADAREYEVLMDEHSHHHVLIHNGVARDETPEFASFHRTYAPLWPAIAEYLLQLEGICTQYAVPLATVDGKALAELASSSHLEHRPPMEQLLACIVNIGEVAGILRQPGRRFQGPDGYSAAATLIQAYARGCQARRQARSCAKTQAAARHIQHAWRTHQLREALARRMHGERAAREGRFEQLQAQFRDRWADVMMSHRIIVHVPSLTLTPAQRAAIPNVPLAENAQMARVCDVADPLCDVVYVAPFPVDDTVVQFWEKLLEAGGVEAPSSRLRIIYPENCRRLPERMSLTAKLLASPRALRRLQLILQGRNAFIVPGVPGDSDMDLAVTLNTPLLAAHPMISRALSTKSGARAVFRSARMNVAPGVSILPAVGPMAEGGGAPDGTLDLKFALKNGELQVTEQGAAGVGESERKRPARRKDADLCLSIAKIMVDFITVQRWLIKIEDEDNGRGHAFFDVTKLHGAAAVLQKLAAQQAEMAAGVSSSTDSAGSRVANTAAAEHSQALAAMQGVLEDAKLQAVHKLNVICLNHLRKALKIVTPSAFPDYRAFIQAVRSRGAVIEAAAGVQLGSPTVNMLLEPTGAVKIVSTMEQIFRPAYRTVGHSFPQSSVVHSALFDAASSIGNALVAQKVIGHVSVDFVVLRENGLLRMWATDLNLHPTQALASYQLFDFLAAGEFNARRGTYTVTEDADETASAPSTGGMNYEASVEAKSEVARATSQRFFVSCESLRHPGLAPLNYGRLFHLCRAGGRVFNMEDRTGTAFALLDGASAGTLSTQCVGHTLHDSLAEMAQTLEFLDRAATEAAPSASAGADEFRATAATIRFLSDRLAPLVVSPPGQI